MRWMDPWYSAFMLDAALDASRAGKTNYHTDYRWADLEQISPHAAVAVIASEDQFFPFHTGFDFKSIREAMRAQRAAGRAASGRTCAAPAPSRQQVAKNLFLWPGRSYLRKGLEVVLHAAHRAHLAEGTHPRGVSQHRAVRRRHLRRRSRGAALLAHAGGAARPLRERDAGRGAAESDHLQGRTRRRLCAPAAATGSWRRCAGSAAPLSRRARESDRRRRRPARAAPQIGDTARDE